MPNDLDRLPVAPNADDRTTAPRRRPHALRRNTGAFVAVGIAALIAAGCGSVASKSAGPAGVPAGNTATAGTPAPAAATKITATLTEFHIGLSRTNVTPGTYTFVAVNAGHTLHGLEINGPGVADQATAHDVPPGQSADLTVVLKAGNYDVFCPVGDHKDLGMDLQLRVSGGAAPGGAAPTVAPGPTTAPSSGPSASGGGYGY